MLCLGASNFILASYPDFALLPFAKSTPPEYQAALAAYSKTLADYLSSLANNPPYGARIAYIDMYNLFPPVLANPEQYGFSPTVVGQNCISGVFSDETVPRSLCSDPDSRVVRDSLHVRALRTSLTGCIRESVLGYLPPISEGSPTHRRRSCESFGEGLLKRDSSVRLARVLPKRYSERTPLIFFV